MVFLSQKQRTSVWLPQAGALRLKAAVGESATLAPAPWDDEEMVTGPGDTSAAVLG